MRQAGRKCSSPCGEARGIVDRRNRSLGGWIDDDRFAAPDFGPGRRF